LRAEAPAVDTTIALRLAPPEIGVGIFYRGRDVQVEANIPDCDGAVLVLDADGEDVTLNRKGREAGIWLNVAQLTVSGAPKVYLLTSSKPLDELCPEDIQRGLGLGIGSLRGRITVACEKPLVGTEVDEFLKLKMQRGTYRTDTSLTLTPAGKGRQNLFARLPVPATVAPGHYRVALYCFRNGGLVSQGASELNIRRVGLADSMATLAQKHAAAYGVLAIVVAMSVGIVMGIVFHSLPGSGH
jgi:uncharacterized protein (TIGR02186 family)